jgi:hypothetical protein
LGKVVCGRRETNEFLFAAYFSAKRGRGVRVRRCRYQAHVQRITGLFMRNKWRWVRGMYTRFTDFDQERAVMPEAEHDGDCG